MGRLAARWSAWWFRSGPPHALALARVGVGTVLLLRWLELAPHAVLLLSREGLFAPLEGLAWAGPPPGLAAVLLGAAIVSAAGVVAGAWTRVSLALQLGLLAYHWAVYLHATNFSYDPLSALLVACLLPSPCGRALSLDAWRARRRGRPVPRAAPLWTQRLLCVQTAFVYFGSGLFKVSAPVWHDGAVLRETLQGMWATELAFAIVRLDLAPAVYDLAALAVVAFEISVPWLLWNRRTLPLAAALGIAFHGGVLLLLGIWQFLVVPPLYVLFADPEEVRRWVERQRTRFAAWRTGSATVR